MNENFSYRVKFTKTGNLKFIGHLDLLKLIERVTKRADIPIAYSKGFNPHQIISFAAPLPLGMESTAEYLDFKMTEKLDYEEILKRFNHASAIGMEFLKVREIEKGEKAAACVCAADYEITADKKIPENIIRDILEKKEIKIEKRTKKKTVESNLREDIFEIRASDNRVFAKISAGNTKNLKPDVLMQQIYLNMGEEFIYYKMKYKRTELYKRCDNNFVPLIM